MFQLEKRKKYEKFLLPEDATKKKIKKNKKKGKNGLESCSACFYFQDVFGWLVGLFFKLGFVGWQREKLKKILTGGEKKS